MYNKDKLIELNKISDETPIFCQTLDEFIEIVEILEKDFNYSFPTNPSFEECGICVYLPKNGKKCLQYSSGLGYTKRMHYRVTNASVILKGTRKFKLGKIAFKDITYGRIHNYFTNGVGIPSDKLKYGSVYLDIDNYNRNKAEIVDFHDKYYLVKYLDSHRNFVILGFKEESLEEVETKINNVYVPKPNSGYTIKARGVVEPMAEPKRVKINLQTIKQIKLKYLN